MNNHTIFSTISHPVLRTPTHDQNATLALLSSSILVSISGAMRVYLAALLLNTSVDWITCLAGGLIIYSVYTLDRALDCEEDLINRGDLAGSSKQIGLAVTVFTFLIGALIFAKEGILALAFLPFATGFLYSKGIKIGKYSLRLKGGLGVKNIVVGITWGLSIIGTARHDVSNAISLVSVFILYGGKTLINSVLDDFKDIKGDTFAGLRTLPVSIGKTRTRDVLLGIHFISHSLVYAALVCGYIAFEPVIIIGSFVCGLICILRYTNEDRYRSEKVFMTCLKDGESVIISIIKIVGSAV